MTEVFRGEVAQGPIVDPADVAEAAPFLMSSRSTYIKRPGLVAGGDRLGSAPMAR